MSSRKKKVLSLEEKVRIIRMYKAVKHRSERRGFRLLYHQIIDDQQKILAQYHAMQAKIAAVRDLVKTEYGKPNYIGEKHAFLEKIITEWYQRVTALAEMKKIPLGLIGHKTEVAMRILNITDLPLSETQLGRLKSKCHNASLESKTKPESKTLVIKEIAKELLVKMGISKETAISVYGPDIFEGPYDDEDDEENFLRDIHHVKHHLEKRKLEQQEEPPRKTARTSNAVVGWDLKRDWTEDEEEEEEEEEEVLTGSDSDTNTAYTKVWPYEEEVIDDNRSEKEDIQQYDVISVEDSSDEFDAASSSKNIIPDLLIKKECETSIGSGEEGVAPLIKVEPVEGQCVSNVHERADELLIKNECETTDEEFGKIKIESEDLDLNCDNVPTSTCSQDSKKQEVEETNSDDDRLVHLYTVASEDSSDADSTSRSVENDRCVENYEDAMHILERLKAYLKKQRNGRALEALSKVEAAFPQSAKK